MPLDQFQENLERRMEVRSMEADMEPKHEQAGWEPWKVMAALTTAVGMVAAGVFGTLGYMPGLLQHHG